MMQVIPYCFTKNEVIHNFKDKYQFDNWIKTNLKNDRIVKIRNSLYASLDSMKSTNVSKYEIAAKVTPNGYIGYHSALEYYGLANQVYNAVTICSDTRFNEFTFEGITYSHKSSFNFTQVLLVKGGLIRVTSLERTLIDCIDKIDLAGGIEEIMNALDSVHFLDESKLLAVLKSIDSIYLYQKVGYIFEQYRSHIKLSDNFFDECKKHLTNQVKYFLKNEFNNLKYNDTWRLIAPLTLFDSPYEELQNELVKSGIEEFSK